VHPSLLPAADQLDPLLLTEIAAGLAQALALEPAPPDHAPPQLLLRTHRYAAWYVGWSPGASRATGDRALGVLHVVHGTLVEQRDDLPHVAPTRVAHAGDAIALGGAMATRVANTTSRTAWVVHVTSAVGDERDERSPLRLVS
jgi:hypothetical protein